MANRNIDYSTANFEYLVLAKIHGIPTYEFIRKIKNGMKLNAVSVPYDLGGGVYGHLVVMLTGPEYANVSVTDYVRTLHPGILIILVGTTNYEWNRLTNEHKKLLRLNRYDNNVEA